MKKAAKKTVKAVKKTTKTAAKALPTLAACEKALGEKAATWVARCYEISFRIVKAGLVKGEAVYGHWLGPVHSKSHFADRGTKLPFVQHGWILLEDGRVLDPTRWVFEAKEPYLYVGEPPDDWDIVPCKNCGLLEEEHDRDLDDCGYYETEKWPYDEGGNQWRGAMGRPAPVPKSHDPRFAFRVRPDVAVYVAALLGQVDGTKVTLEQIFWLANLPYQTIVKACGGQGVKEIYQAICTANESYGAFIPSDNVNRARREFGFDPGR